MSAWIVFPQETYIILLNMASDSLLNPHFTREEPLPEIQAHFSSTPWAVKLFQDPALVPFHPRTMEMDHPHTAFTFVGQTLATEDTIAAWQSFYKPSPSHDMSWEVCAALKLGSGVNGHSDTCHGGFISVILDDVIGTAVHHAIKPGDATMTAYLNTSYKRPVRTPGVILARSWIEKIEGKKVWARGTIEDGQGNVLTTGEALFLTLHPKPNSKI